ncbi:hypothetical protein [Flavobacterium foetidum]|uniref:hypothetical protein n=1 Tax=Flavobacterium foetidum TaxID=2026681 RepID=UPI0010753F0A|nr:hypothetical protein [Flavobacterium foetidum]KAF2514325.1 hypothetical protein E0W73_13070 [Flavobacterium foetidum]
MKKEKIEDIFSSMENFSSVPPPELWGQIEEKLDKPKKKKRAVLWWSAAACLLLGLLLPSILHFTDLENKAPNQNGFENNNVVLDENKNNTNVNRNIPESGNKIIKNNSTNSTAGIGENEEKINQNADKDKNELENNSFDNPKNDAVALDEKTDSGIHKNEIGNTNPASKTNGLSNNSKENKKANHSIVHTNEVSGQKKQKQNNYYTEPNSQRNSPNQSAFVFASSDEKTAGKTAKTQFGKSNSKKTLNQPVSEQRIAFGKKQNNFYPATNKTFSNSIFEAPKTVNGTANLAFTNSNNSGKNTANSSSTKAGNGNSPTTDSGISKENPKFANALTKQDSIQLAALQNLEKGIQTPENAKEEKEKKDKALTKGERWAVALFAGVANSENYKNEKTLGNVNDSKQSNSYGVKTRYSITKKWAVGTGLKINELGQSVANISYASARTGALFAPGNESSNAPAAQFSSSSDYVLISNSTKEAVNSDNIKSGTLDQNLRYLEMPLEVSYSVFNRKKASINLNTGGFVGRLISNHAVLDGQSIGQNVNANDFVYGSTLSSTIQYQVYKKTNVFVEPAMNYYINPLNSQSFNQFQWGFNFGLNFSF